MWLVNQLQEKISRRRPAQQAAGICSTYVYGKTGPPDIDDFDQVKRYWEGRLKEMYIARLGQVRRGLNRTCSDITNIMLLLGGYRLTAMANTAGE